MRRGRRFLHRSAALLAVCIALLWTAPAAAQGGVMMQYFHWYNTQSDNLWQKVADQADELAAAGFTALWLPPAYKGQNGSDVGYGVYDLYDLGEFNQKGSVRTKYGTKAEYLAAIQAAHANGLQIYGDVVLNHRGGADATEWVEATRVQTYDRNQEYGGNVWIQAWTDFQFPGRGNTYSSFKWKWYHFDGVDWAQNLQESGKIYKFRGTGKAWDWEVDAENGNYDYLMFADVDFEHPDVRTELENWGVWYVNTTGVDGLRFDAVKHIQFGFFPEFLSYVRTTTGKPLFAVGEYWHYDVAKLHNFLTKTNGTMSLFDAPLHLNFYNASHGGGNYDMRNLMNGTLMKDQPAKAVTLVENHDTQPLQALESPVDNWFKPLAYAFILLREEGYPSVFYADYYGASYTDRGITVNLPSFKTTIDKLLEARRTFGWGPQYNYLDHWNIIGWTRLGDAGHPRAMAVILSDGPGGSKWMEVGKANARFTDLLGNRAEAVTTNEWGWGEFPVNGGSVSVWVQDPIAANQVSVYFTCNNGSTVTGQDVYVVGSIPALGSWNTSQAIKLSPINYPTWGDAVGSLPSNTQVEWKCIKKQGTSVVWQAGANNVLTTPLSGSTTASGSFGGPIPPGSVPGALWTRALTRVTWPSRDSFAAVVFRDRLWVLGGWGTGPLQDVWSSPDGIDWQSVGDAPWPARKAHTCVVFQDRLWVLGGGTGGTEQANDVWSSPDGKTWTQVTAEAPWSRRLNHASAVFDGKIWVLGGWGGRDLSDVWSSPDGKTWTQVAAAAPWTGRNGHSVVVHDGRLWVLGGWGQGEKGDGNLNDVWSSSDGSHWERATAHAPWAPRNHQSAVVWDGRIWVLGGWGLAGVAEENLNDVWSSTDGATWRPATGQAQWLPRNGHASVVFLDRMWVIGGWSHFIGGAAVNDLWSSGR